MSNALLDDSGSAAPRSAGSALLNRIPQKVLAIADQGVVSGGTFLATVAVARWADAHQLGAYSLGMSGLFTIMGIQEALIALPYMIRRNRPEAEAVGLAGQSLVQSALLSAATAGALVILALFLTAARSDSSLPAFVCALAWLAPFFLLREFARQFCFAHMQFAQALAMDGSALLLQVSGLALVELVWGLSATSVCITNGLAFGLVGVRWFYLQRANFRMPVLRLRQVLKENWSLGRWLLAAQIAASFQASIASWLLAIVDGTEAAGVYAACLAIVALSNPVIIGIANHLMPRTTVILRQEGVAALRPKPAEPEPKRR
jgi:O-antigen/teichoic acid export membrane protein